MDEETLKTRLLLDSKALKRLVRRYSAYNLTKSKDTLIELKASIDLYELSLQKYQLMDSMHSHEIESYTVESKDIEKMIHEADLDIEALQQQLVDAELIRINKQEYDEIAKEISKYQSVAQSDRKIAASEREIELLQSVCVKHEAAINTRKVQFELIVAGVCTMQDAIIEETQSRMRSRQLDANEDEDAIVETGEDDVRDRDVEAMILDAF